MVSVISFFSTIPSDVQWTDGTPEGGENASVLVPGGDKMSHALVEIFTKAGYFCSSPEVFEDYAWEFSINFKMKSLRCLLYDAEPWEIRIAAISSSWWTSIPNDQVSVIREVSLVMLNVLKYDERFFGLSLHEE